MSRACADRGAELGQLAVVADPGPGQDLAGQAETVGVEARGGEPEQHVAGHDPVRSEQAVALDHAEGEPGQVVGLGLHRAGMLGRLPAEQGAAGQATALGHPGHDGGHPGGVDPADGQVVEDEQWLGPGNDHVVDHHGDQVDADGVVAVEGLGDQQLGADPVAGRGQHRVGGDAGPAQVPGQPPQPGEAADAAQHPGPVGRLDRRPHQRDRAVPGLDVDPGLGVGQCSGPSSSWGARPSSSSLPWTWASRDRVVPVKQRAEPARPFGGVGRGLGQGLQ